MYLLTDLLPKHHKLFSTVKSNYDFDLVNNQPGWAYAGGKPARWITEAGRQQIFSILSSVYFEESIFAASSIALFNAVDEVLVDSIEFADDEIILEKDESKEIKVTINPEDATNKELVWESRNSRLAGRNNALYLLTDLLPKHHKPNLRIRKCI